MMTSTRLVLSASIAISLAQLGCQKESPTSESRPVASVPSGSAGVAGGMSADLSAPKDSVALPLTGLKLDFPYQVQSDSTYTQAKTGQLRRAIVLEFSESDIRIAFDRTAAALKAMGYNTKAEPIVGDDVISQSFFGRGGAYLETRKSLGARPKDPASGGVVALSWPIKSTGEPVPLGQ